MVIDPLSTKSARSRRSSGGEVAGVAVALVLLTAAVYAPVRSFGFVNLDDQQYVYENAAVQAGLTWQGAAEAFSTFRASNWHPLTWLSHMADVSLFGMDPGAHHLVSVLLHAVNALLLFTFLRGVTGANWPSAVVSALFAVHPLHVESVAWISERKDTLSTFFLLVALHGYRVWVRSPRLATYLAVAVPFGLGLLSKPMVVTFPFLLLLLDRWPLARSGWSSLVREKIPLFAMSGAACVVTWSAQADAAMSSVGSVPAVARLENAVVSYGAYLWQTVWPRKLAAIYPHPALVGMDVPGWQVALSLAVLCAVTVVAVRERERHPYLLVGWLWYLGTLVPVIGLVQVGLQARADRYTYVPLVGVFIACVWLAWGWLSASPARRRAAALGLVLVVGALGTVARAQVGTWRDAESLNRHALTQTERNWIAWNGLGGALSVAKRPREAIEAFQECLRIRPDFAPAWNGIGSLYGETGRADLALVALQEAVRHDPRLADAWYNLGTAQEVMGRHAEAVAALRTAVGLAPDHARAWFNLGVVSLVLGDAQGLATSHAALLRLSPPDAADLERRAAAAARAPRR